MYKEHTDDDNEMSTKKAVGTSRTASCKLRPSSIPWLLYVKAKVTEGDPPATNLGKHVCTYTQDEIIALYVRRMHVCTYVYSVPALSGIHTEILDQGKTLLLHDLKALAMMLCTYVGMHVS